MNLLQITRTEVVTALGTRVGHDGSSADIQRARAQAEYLDEQKSAAATSRAQRVGYDKPLTLEQVRDGSWRNETQSVRVRVAIESADKAYKSGDHERAALLLRQHANGCRAMHKVSNFSDPSCEADAKLLESLASDYRERGRFLAEAKPAPTPDAPTVPAWIEKHKQSIRDDWRLTEDQKRRRLQGLDEIERKEQAKIDAEAERKRMFDRSEYTGALADATTSVGLAELSRDLPEEFVQGARQRLEQLKATGDDVTYWAETTVAESKVKAFRDLKKSEREAQTKADALPATGPTLYDAPPAT